MILKKDDDGDDDMSEVEDDPELADDEVWLHSKQENNVYRRKRTVQFKVGTRNGVKMIERSTSEFCNKEGRFAVTVRPSARQSVCLVRPFDNFSSGP